MFYKSKKTAKRILKTIQEDYSKKSTRVLKHSSSVYIYVDPENLEVKFREETYSIEVLKELLKIGFEFSNITYTSPYTNRAMLRYTISKNVRYSKR